MTGKGFIFLCFLLSASWTLPAQEADTLAAASIYSVKALPVVRATEEVYLPGLVSPPVQVADVLRRFTGLQVKDYGGAGGLKTVNVRSLGSEHVGVFIDGIQVDNAQNMQVDLGRFSTDGIDRVSLYNGQKSCRLQTAKEYAAGAAVYLDSEVPAASGGRVRLRGGSFGTLNPSLQWNQALGPVTLRASADFLSSDGRYSYPCFDTTLVRENGDIRSLRIESQAFGNLRQGDWRLRLYSYGSERGFPGPVIRRALGFPFSAERQADQDLFVQGAWNQEWTERYTSSFKFKYANNYTHYDTHPEKNPMALPYDLHYRQQSAYTSLAQSLVLAKPWSIDLSTDFQYNTLDSDAGQSVTPRRLSVLAALATRLAWQRFRAAAHLVYQGAWDWFRTPDAGGWTRENSYRDAWMPSLSLYYAPFDWLEADAFVKRSYRLPSFNDLYYSQMGNSNLLPESALQTGFDFRLKKNRGNWSWDVRLSPYYNRVENKIVALPTSSQFRWTMLNIGRVDIAGLDAETGLGFRRGAWAVELTLRYSYQSALDHSSPESQTWGNQIPYIPRHSGSGHLLVEWGGCQFSWVTLCTGERWSRTANTADYHISPWSTSDVSLARILPLAIHGRPYKLEVSLTCNNVFNHHYQIVQGYPMPGTNVSAAVSFIW